MRLAWQLAKRFRQAKQKNRFISFISFSSTVGIALGCFVLITLLSVMNGFERELTQRILSVIPHGEIYATETTGIRYWQAQQHRLLQDPRVSAVEPYTKITGMLQFKGDLKAVEITGLAVDDATAPGWRAHVQDSHWQAFVGQPDAVLLGKGIAQRLAISPGDSVQVLIPTVTDDLSFKAPQSVTLTVAGTLNIGGEMDNYLGMMHLAKASEAMSVDSGAQGLRFTLADPFSAYQTMRDIGYTFPQAAFMSDWTRTQGHLYNDIQLVRMVVYISLTLVIAVACFNIVSTLVMAVREKRAAIAILKTMGAPDGLIRAAFVLQGMINGVTGIVIGTLAALAVAPNLSAIVAAIEGAFGISVLSGDIYFIDFLPTELHGSDVLITVLVAFVLCIFATLYPAHKAVQIKPASALNG